MPENSFHTDEWFEAFYERNYKQVYRLCLTYILSDIPEAERCLLTPHFYLCPDT